MLFRPTVKCALLLCLTTLALVGCLSDEGESNFSGDIGDTGGSTNQAPLIGGNPPAAVTIGETFSFTPIASDPDGDPLTFSIANKPSWASFDTGTGRLSGSPTLTNVGMTSNIRITVSDGDLSASTSNFSIDVTQAGTESTTLSWTAPTLNEDGSVLTDLAGYKIYYGMSPGNFTNTIRIDNPSVTNYVLDNLSPATYYIAAVAFNSAGVESRFSNEASIALQ